MKRILLAAFALLSLSVAGVMATAAPQVVRADAQQQICEGIGAASGANCTDGSKKINSTVKGVIGLFSTIVGIAAVIVIIAAGFRYVTSGGDSSKINSAKTELTYAIVGLAVAAMAQFIVKFVLNKTT